MKFFKEIKDDFAIKKPEVNYHLTWSGKFGKTPKRNSEKNYNHQN